MKKLPKIYQNESLGKINNNKKTYDSLKDDNQKNDDLKKVKSKNINKNTKKNNLSVKTKIKDLIQDNNYIFNKKVTLVFDDHEKVCNIAGVVNNHIITMDNEIIKIDLLKDIIY